MAGAASEHRADKIEEEPRRWSYAGIIGQHSAVLPRMPELFPGQHGIMASSRQVGNCKCVHLGTQSPHYIMKYMHVKSTRLTLNIIERSASA